MSRTGSARGKESAAQAIGEQVRTLLSNFYDRAFVDPSSWQNGVPASAWDAFEPGLRDKALADADALSIGAIGEKVVDLIVTQGDLTVTVLLDTKGQISAATGDVRFVAAGMLPGGVRVQVVNHSAFLFREVGGTWMIVAYPVASTNVDTSP